MQSSILSLLALGLAFCSPASAVYSYSTISSCTTRYGPQSVSVKSTGLSLTVPITYTQKSTTTRGSTITPSPTTVFATNTITNTAVTTLSPTNTLTITSSATITSTLSTDTTVTSTFSTTVSSTPPTSTVPTVAGFTPLYSASDYVAKRDVLVTAVPAIRGRAIEPRATSSAPGRVSLSQANGALAFSPSQYPTQIICGTLIEAISTTTQILTASAITTTTLPPTTNTMTTAVTTTVTSTSTLTPVTASTTIATTITTSTTLTNTAVTSITATNVLVGPTPSAYAACQANNAVNSANGGHGISGLTHTSGSNFVNVSPQDFSGCCGTCQSIGGCQGYIYFSGDNTCFLIIGNTCDATQNFGDTYNTSPSLPIANVVGNGPCGQLLNQGNI